MFPKGRQEKAMQLIAGLSGQILILRVLVKVVDGVKGKEDLGFPETPLVVHPVLGVGVPIGEGIKAPGIQL